MKLPSNLLVLLPLSLACALAEDQSPIQSAVLDEHALYTVPVATNRVTTISFPSPIEAIDAANVTTDPKVPGKFQLAHAPGSSFVSLRALGGKETTNLNVRWNEHTYVFRLVASPKPVLSLILEARTSHPEVDSSPNVSPTRLLVLLDKAKAFPLLKAQKPESVASVDFKTHWDPPSFTDCGDYEIQIEEAYRFNPEDTLVFRLALHNKTDRAIRFRPDSFALRVGDRLYPQSISDATGIMPPKSSVPAYFAVTGTPDGWRNELSLNNQFAVLLERLPTPAPTTNAPPSKAPSSTK